MAIRDRIQNWLGITAQANYSRDAERYYDGILRRLDRIEARTLSSESALARIVAKLDPAYLQDPSDPAVRAASDKLGREVIAKLDAEAIIRNQYNY